MIKTKGGAPIGNAPVSKIAIDLLSKMMFYSLVAVKVPSSATSPVARLITT